jgi:preprotein translocase subunit SecD
MKKRNLLVRGIIILVVALLGIVVIIRPHHKPTKRDFTWTGIKENLAQNIHLGLDLRGGSHLVMHVKVEEALQQMAENNADAAFSAAKDKGLPVTDRAPVRNPDPTAKRTITPGPVQFKLVTSDPSKAKDIETAVAEKVDVRDWDLSTSGNTMTWTMKSKVQNDFASGAVTQALKVIDTRINAVGVVEPTLQTHGATGSNQILLQMPGLDDPERVKQLLSTQSRLELVHVEGPASPQPVQKYPTQELALQSLGVPPGGTPPPNKRVLPYTEPDEPAAPGATPDPNQAKPKQCVVVEYPPIVNGIELRDAQAVTTSGSQNDYQIHFSLKTNGAAKFGPWTGANINQYMGVVLNDEVKSIAYIQSQITDSGQINGKFSKERAEDLALTLRSGALPAEIEYIEERTVGPSLGADSIKAGVRASLAGLALVIAFILFYYRGSGVNAVVALILNMILMVAALIIFGATLTLPGIAGIILTIGMAVDSNVLVFERIREELRAGKSVGVSIEQGFAHAFVTIIDTHVTTIISSLFLFVFGTGPIRGFAVTLILGLLINLFTAVYVSRTIFQFVLSRKERVESLSI